MELDFCKNCQKQTMFKRQLGFGTLFAMIFTLGFWFLAIPFYPMRCSNCGEKYKRIPWLKPK